MAITKEKKEQIVSSLAADLKDVKGLVFADYKGLTVNEFESLRAKMREKGARMSVVKLTLMKKAFEEAGLPTDFDFTVPTAIAYSPEDEVAPAKTAADFAKSNDKLVILAGLLNGNLLGESEVKDLAKLPSTEELRGKFVGVLVGPMRGMVGVLSGVQRNFVYALKAIADNKS